MAIAIDANSAKAAPNATDTTLTWAHTCTGSNGFLLVAIQAYSLVASADIVSGVTYNGVAMTRLDIQNSSASTNYSTYVYYLAGPATGANNIVVTYTTAPGFGAHWGIGTSYSGVKQTGFPDANSKGTQSGSGDVTGTVTTSADNAWVWMVSAGDDGPTIAAGSGTTLRQKNAIDFLNHGELMATYDANAAKTPAGSVSLIADMGTSDSFSNWIIASMAPAVAATSTPHRLMMMGVGR